MQRGRQAIAAIGLDEIGRQSRINFKRFAKNCAAFEDRDKMREWCGAERMQARDENSTPGAIMNSLLRGARVSFAARKSTFPSPATPLACRVSFWWVMAHGQRPKKTFAARQSWKAPTHRDLRVDKGLPFPPF